MAEPMTAFREAAPPKASSARRPSPRRSEAAWHALARELAVTGPVERWLVAWMTARVDALDLEERDALARGLAAPSPDVSFAESRDRLCALLASGPRTFGEVASVPLVDHPLVPVFRVRRPDGADLRARLHRRPPRELRAALDELPERVRRLAARTGCDPGRLEGLVREGAHVATREMDLATEGRRLRELGTLAERIGGFRTAAVDAEISGPELLVVADVPGHSLRAALSPARVEVVGELASAWFLATLAGGLVLEDPRPAEAVISERGAIVLHGLRSFRAGTSEVRVLSAYLAGAAAGDTEAVFRAIALGLDSSPPDPDRLRSAIRGADPYAMPLSPVLRDGLEDVLLGHWRLLCDLGLPVGAALRSFYEGLLRLRSLVDLAVGPEEGPDLVRRALSEARWATAARQVADLGDAKPRDRFVTRLVETVAGRPRLVEPEDDGRERSRSSTPLTLLPLLLVFLAASAWVARAASGTPALEWVLVGIAAALILWPSRRMLPPPRPARRFASDEDPSP